MKKVLTFIVLMSLPILAAGQNAVSANKDNSTTLEIAVEKIDTIKEHTALKAETKTQVIDLNHKKSIDLISIKAYRISLQIKVKTIKRC
jgi:hypothetical protein